MNKIVSIICVALFSLNVHAQSDSIAISNDSQLESVQTQVNDLQTIQVGLASQVEGIELVVKEIQKSVSRLSSANNSVVTRLSNAELDILRLDSAVLNNSEDLLNKSNQIIGSIQMVNDSAQASADRISSNLLLTILVGSMIALVLLGVSLLLYFILKRNTSSAYDRIKSAQKALEEEGIKLDAKLIELLEKQVSIQKVTGKDVEPDHSLALKVADEIVRIETNLSRMDSTVKGYKQLSASVRRIKDNFLSNGYEMVDMLGKPYKEGMKAIVDFETDESLNEGEQIITRIIKPQINYNGIMIQTAQITVSQNA